MEREVGNTEGQAVHDDVSLNFFHHEIDLPATTSDSRQYTQTDCPAHDLSSSEPPRPKIPPGIHPSQRLEYTPCSDLPLGLSGGCRVGTSASAGCICKYNPDILKDKVISEMEILIKEAKQDGEKQQEERST
ncbi:hypothetical protein COCC4DRAFT_199758 [Bipolaris maydis ATCC 48331]|uniref:Uncharacterized protein n=2 Tax=Cochliobolus heterostrophus TaxID=5016 RepID=M2TMH5_COCH5|nr:uncharacterized protein COCC4DRAFT_199758 [Bipolaris maydis ATCC 48331]EMD87729.1 hypothetical protein COCHEDRAFT_1143194 [Bipolaris maydis C5]ENI03242.1 hypothetical protein COCC4DRAFT_199758 [Bipolaris maydis ATCC 48331]KAJ5057418.1 hypothetical protein J3E74DRAFT_249663 [Bipolaris maydis]KAJ6206723.1 hypothetical protein PSV09DRAFT_1143194 [Bipolaris maydis]